MIQRQLKLRLTKFQEATLERYLWHLTGVYNWTLRKIELDARDGIYHSNYGLDKMTAGHGPKIEVPSKMVRGTINTAHEAWRRCFKGIGGKPKFKSRRNRLSSISIPRDFAPPKGSTIAVPGLGRVRFHKMDLPAGVIKQGRLVRRASGWHLCLFIGAASSAIPHIGNGIIGIDPGFSSLLTLSTGEKITHPREYEASVRRLGQAQRGKNKRLAARLSERIANQRRDRNHKLSRRLVSENQTIVFSADHHSAIAKRFGKSVHSSGHYQLRQMLDYKCRAGGRTYIEVDSKNSTRTCSACGALTGPKGLAGLSVRLWRCEECGISHDRDGNAALNVLKAGVGTTHEIAVNASPKSLKSEVQA